MSKRNYSNNNYPALHNVIENLINKSKKFSTEVLIFRKYVV